MKITEWIETPNPFGLVRIEGVVDKPIAEDDLDIEQQVILKTSKKLMEEILIYVASSGKFVVRFNMKTTEINQIIQNAILILTNVFNHPTLAYDKRNEIIQNIFAETNLTRRLNKINLALMDVRQRIKVLLDLEKDATSAAQEEEVKKPERDQKVQEEIHKIKPDDHIEDAKRFRAKLDNKIVPKVVMEKFEEEVGRYLSMSENSPESNIIRTYLDIITSLPWGNLSQDRIDIELAKKILDEGHYGMEDIKQRILEFLAIGKLQNRVQGKILCFVGPPGVGKTSIGESIAKAVNRKFMRISVGGDKDTLVLKGSRRTYIGAMPGKIVQGLKNVQVENPVILIDEVDKIVGASHQGDPSSVLLEILDPEQNTNFTDDYLDVPVDLSRVLFLCTANVTHTIPKPLLDRMEIIQVSGYTHAEKQHIFENYLKPQAIESSGMKGKEKEYAITQDAVNKMIEDYCREPGVRGLQRGVKKIYEKLALKLVENGKNLTVDVNNLEEYIGRPPFHSARIYKQTPVVRYF